MLARRLRAATSRTVGNEIIFLTALSQSQTSSPTGTFTFSNVNLGSTFYGRRISLVVTILSNNNPSTSFVISSVNVAGNPANNNQGGGFQTGGAAVRAIGFYSIADATSSTATIQVNLLQPGTSDHCIIHLYSVNTARSESSLGQDPTSPFQLTTTFPANSLALYAGVCSDTASVSWTNATERATTTISGQYKLSTATYYPTAAETRTVTFTPSVTTNAALYGDNWR